MAEGGYEAGGPTDLCGACVCVCVHDVGIKHGLWEKLEEGGQHSPKHSFQSNAG